MGDPGHPWPSPGHPWPLAPGPWPGLKGVFQNPGQDGLGGGRHQARRIEPPPGRTVEVDHQNKELTINMKHPTLKRRGWSTLTITGMILEVSKWLVSWIANPCRWGRLGDNPVTLRPSVLETEAIRDLTELTQSLPLTSRLAQEPRMHFLH